jgi:predicted enzyme related to lactoylglutathione lyase
MNANIAHFAINADDVSRARRFYEAVFPWRFAAWGPPGFYRIETGDAAGPGIFGALQQRRNWATNQPTIGYECTIGVADVDSVAAAIPAAGGRILMARTTIAGVGDLIFFEDTEGNVAGAMTYDTQAG